VSEAHYVVEEGRVKLWVDIHLSGVHHAVLRYVIGNVEEYVRPKTAGFQQPKVKAGKQLTVRVAIRLDVIL
jgi:hypothetical protein